MFKFLCVFVDNKVVISVIRSPDWTASKQKIITFSAVVVVIVVIVAVVVVGFVVGFVVVVVVIVIVAVVVAVVSVFIVVVAVVVVISFEFVPISISRKKMNSFSYSFASG